jgi:hypothetical protein
LDIEWLAVEAYPSVDMDGSGEFIGAKPKRAEDIKVDRGMVDD